MGRAHGASGHYDLSLRASVMAVISAPGKKQRRVPVEERLAARVVPVPVPGARAVRSFEDVQPGVLVAGFVCNPTDKGVFVALAPGVTGRVKVGMAVRLVADSRVL